jgi:Bromodomain
MGRDVAGHFLDLPDAEEYPDYYQQIAMPISLNMIEQRLANFEYATMEKLEGDLKRMVQNAKDYNDSKSEVFADAERIRKALSNFMPKNNPAYSDPDYRAVPTPIPQALLDRMRESSVSTAATGPPERVKLVLKSRQSMPVSTDGEEDLSVQMTAMLEGLSSQPDAV